jgi:hypothetical protein
MGGMPQISEADNPTADQPAIKGPNFEPRATARRFGDPKAVWETTSLFSGYK